MQIEDHHLEDLSSRCEDLLTWYQTGALPDGALRNYANRIPSEHVRHATAVISAERETEKQALKLVAGMKGMSPLLPPTAIGDDYLAGWCEGQAYLIMNYGTEEAVDAMLRAADRMDALQERITALEEALKHARRFTGESLTGLTDTVYLDRILAGENA